MPPATSFVSCRPTIGSREHQPSRSGSKAPSSRGGGGSPAARAAGEVDEAVALHELAGDRRQPGARVAERQPGPLRQVAILGGPVAGEVPARQLGQSRVPVDGGRLSEPVPDEDVRVLLPVDRPAHDRAAQRREKEHVHERLALGADARRGDPLA